MAEIEQRESWGSRWGLVLAAAGNAIGIGNLLRFPAQAGQNGGGAFMIPYVVSLLLFGLPMMWVAWTIGRMGGRYGHGSTPGMFEQLWKHPFAKYLGVLGLALPMAFCFYYTYIESWCLSYSWFSLTHDFESAPDRYVHLGRYLDEYLGNSSTHSYFPGYNATFTFAVITVLLNVWILYRGVAKGIELLAKIAMPLLFLFCLILVVRVFTLGTIKGSVWDGLSFLWTPDLGALASPKVWLAAAGQIFFTLSIGFGSLECYASYLKDNDDIALTGLTTTATNEFVEVIFGSLIAIPACAVFFGAEQVAPIASSGTFSIGMVSMPEILRSLPGLEFFGTMWFLLLFFAAFTSSVGVAQPVVAFLEDEAKMPKGAAAMIVGLFWFLATIPFIYFFRYGTLDEMDFWAGTLGIVVFAIVEVILFAWVYGTKKGWHELHLGALIRVPSFYRYVIKYVTPVLLLGIFAGWFWGAIRDNTLIPTPRVFYEVEDVHRYPGVFRASAVPPVATAAVDVKRVRGGVEQQVELLRRDLGAWAQAETNPDGTIRVVDLQGDPDLTKVLDAAALQQWMAADGFGYERTAEEPEGSHPGRIQIRVEALHRAPYIWLVRFLFVALTLVFGLVIHALWKKRAAADAAGEVKS